MQTLDHDQVTGHIAAPPQAVYALIADVTRMPEFSPEIVRCTWLDGANGPAVGARFVAVNKVGDGPSWKNRPVVVTADSGREFAFSRTEKFAGTLVWRYVFEPDGEGTLVTESYTVTRPITWLGWLIIRLFGGGPDRRAVIRAGMERTVARVRETAEREARLDTR
ncbi:SRPBCC family protein [Actinophytocola sp.]|uniref:SRPBCC family protein n=1 Tax=Actinophytocola sp. TaxID=1872138 RepID=UPI003D6B360E